MKRNFKSMMALATVLLILVTYTSNVPVYANAAEPPAIVIIVADAPSDLKVSVYFDADAKFVEGRKIGRAHV